MVFFTDTCTLTTIIFTIKMNYLIDESFVFGKGANTVISLVHHFLDQHGLGEMTVSLNADNCTGQNKNNAMIQVVCVNFCTPKSDNHFNYTVPDVACTYPTTQENESVFHATRSHQVCARLGFWPS